MNTIFRYALLRLRGQIIGWGVALAVLALVVASLFDAALQMRGQLEQLLDTMPKEIMMFVGGIDRVFSPAGFLDTRYFSMLPLLLGVFALLIGSGLVVGDEENGTLDLILAHPVRRVRFDHRALAGVLRRAARHSGDGVVGIDHRHHVHVDQIQLD